MQTIQTEKFKWINLEKPSSEEVADLESTYNIHPLVAEELLRPTYRPKVEHYDNCLYLVLHLPRFNSRDMGDAKEIDFIVGHDFVITTHYKKIPFLEKFLAECADNEDSRKHYLSVSTAHLLYHLLMGLFASTLKELDATDSRITKLENIIFKEHHRDVLKEIALLRREVLDFYRIMQPEQAVFSSLEAEGHSFFGKEMAPYFRRVNGEYLRVWSFLENHKQTVEALQDTNASIISTRTNEISKNLTIMAFITFPLTLIASIFGMNTVNNPIVGTPLDFWIIVGFMAVGVLCMFEFFKYKKWL